MAGTGAYAVPVDMLLVAKKPLKTKMSKEAKITDTRTGKTEIRKCERTDED